MELWRNQTFALDETERLMALGVKHWCVTAPTGAGKSRVMTCEIVRAYERGHSVSMYSPRKLITEQLIGYLQSEHLRFGVRAAEFETEFDDDGANIQICSWQTESSRIKRGRWAGVHKSDLVLVDEAHQAVNGKARELIQQHEASGATVIEYTASPLGGLNKFCSELVIAGTNSEMRRIGALVPAKVYDPGCPNLDKVKRDPLTNEFTNAGLKASGYVQSIYASAIAELKKNNPDMKPFLACAPGVAEAMWFADKCEAQGIRVAHIDGECVYRDGQLYESSRAAREDAIHDVREGRLHGLLNRFALREGIDIPELYYLGLWTPIGSLTSYIQTVGRVLRAHPSMTECVIADHGGNARRHGSPNQDWDWLKNWKLTERQIADVRRQDVREGNKDPGTACPKCGRMYGKLPPVCECGAELAAIYKCPACAHCHSEWPSGHKCVVCGEDMKRIRRKPVIQRDGTLKLVPDGDFITKPTVNLGERTQKLWDSIYWSAKKNRKDRTFGQCKAWFIKKHIEEFRCRPPDNGLKNMPISAADWSRRVWDTPPSDLIH